jgi:hypothetical protein
VGAKGNDDAVELGLDFERDLESMAHNLRFCVPPDDLEPVENSED